jgi:hypothetical protein
MAWDSHRGAQCGIDRSNDARTGFRGTLLASMSLVSSSPTCPVADFFYFYPFRPAVTRWDFATAMIATVDSKAP